MYHIYEKKNVGSQFEFSFSEEAHIFGCNEGWIPWLLTKTMSSNQGEPYKWHLDIPALLSANGYPGKSFIIDIKPNADDDIVMGELLNVWGYSSRGWTPFLLEMNMLNFYSADKNKFVHNGEKDIVYSFLYARGSVENGKLTGKWLPASRSPTNAVLLWPDVIKYFFDCIKEQKHVLFA